MNTADFSVLPDELAVSLNPLRRGANRARAFCASLTGMALPWSGSASGPRMRATRMPARWPFPPAPTPEEVAISPAAGGPAAGVPAAGAPAAGAPAAGAPAVDTPASVSAPAAAPVPAAVPVASGARDHSIGDAKAQPVANQLTMKAMITDVVLVLAWGAMIPGLMWLGVAGGF
ncbi:hypothetical protein [Achromobacter mucicolens]|uniref:hypothetical protein n=1 Tax=Achromobacter mucicolens TaxID=1389922 RepID=UPI001CBF7CC9|nr:hypothetical protein [Achromobacter mucicolens]UAN02739.1 hypothetical protein K9D24_00645 [Achromobacter mucicolens]